MIAETLWCDSLYRQNIPAIEIHCQLMLMFGDGVLRPHHLGRGCREFKSRLAFIMKVTLFSPADQEHANAVQVAELVLENHQDSIQDLSIALEWSVKTVANIVLEQLGYSNVYAWWVPRNVMEVHRNLCLQVLFHFFSHLKGEQMGSLNPWWRFETWVHHFTQNELWCSGHIHLNSEPQNVKCASMLEGCCIFILCCRSHQNCIHTLRSKSECEHMLWYAVLTALDY